MGLATSAVSECDSRTVRQYDSAMPGFSKDSKGADADTDADTGAGAGAGVTLAYLVPVAIALLTVDSGPWTVNCGLCTQLWT